MHPGGVLWISSDSDDRINKNFIYSIIINGGKNQKPQKFLGLPAKPQKIPGPEN